MDEKDEQLKELAKKIALICDGFDGFDVGCACMMVAAMAVKDAPKAKQEAAIEHMMELFTRGIEFLNLEGRN